MTFLVTPKNYFENHLPDFSPHALKQPLVTVLAVRDDVEDEVEDEDAVVDPHRDEDDEPGPTSSLVQTQNLSKKLELLSVGGARRNKF